MTDVCVFQGEDMKKCEQALCMCTILAATLVNWPDDSEKDVGRDFHGV